MPSLRRAALILTLAVPGFATLPQLSLAEPATYEIDAVHSSVIWKISHMNTSSAYGRFNDISGKIILDEADPSKSSLEVTVKAESIDSGNQKRDQHLKGPDFLNAKQFPEIVIKSKKISKIDEKTYDVDGTLTLHGVTKPVSFKFTRTGTGKHRSGKDIAGGEAEFTIKRSDFGITYMPQGLGDDIKIMTAIEAIKQ